ncbi:hypothetical protein FHR36_006051 [Kitasatospora paracochleata]|uniref:Uncharacterized protein n=1 Tax=Kitasatospora paracochleata TaxID=58354 RepID=A0ABT1J604_9ACTN|nr:hypothetical protein [Kitasatospora paracochleata]
MTGRHAEFFAVLVLGGVCGVAWLLLQRAVRGLR